MSAFNSDTPKPRHGPKEMPDSLPERDRGSDVAPDKERDPDTTDGSSPDSAPRNDEETTGP